jgi:uncharacterized protein (TIGR03086 family)
MATTETDLLDTVLTDTAATIAAVTPDQQHWPTPCPDFDVARIVDHLVGWMTRFAAQMAGGVVEGNPDDYRTAGDPAAEFRQAAQNIVAAHRHGGEASQQLPVGIILMESLVHGWDVATATGQTVTFSVEAADQALAAGRQMLKPEYRGPGKSFGLEVEVSDAANPLQQLVAFLGRDPHWQPPLR